MKMVQGMMLIALVLPIMAGCENPINGNEDKEVKLTKIYNLPNEIDETSGIIIYDSLLWTFNDNDDLTLYGLDLNTGEITRRILVDATNNDWEDIAQDDEHVYIGDFGNRYGTRTDLCIYVLDKDWLHQNNQEAAEVAKISYYYEDQTDFTEYPSGSAYDCESLFVKGDSLYFFTKNWLNTTTNLYQVPVTPGSYAAKLIATFDSDGLITGADYNTETNELVLCGYKQYVPYLIHFENAWDLNLYDLPKTRTDFLDHFGLQIEGVTLQNSTVYLSAENSFETQGFFSFSEE